MEGESNMADGMSHNVILMSLPHYNRSSIVIIKGFVVI